ncbi:MAG: glycosyltransferase family 2 protein [bacterium]
MKSSKNPKVSVIIPTYNRSQFITHAIDSVLSQTYHDIEIIIVDDGSTDNTKKILINYNNRIKYIYQENQGVAAARNTGIKNAKGKYIAFLDSDDMWLPQKLEQQVKILNQYEDIALVYSNIAYCNSNGQFIRVAFSSQQFLSGYIPQKVILWKAMCGYLQTWLLRKTCFEEVGYIDTSLKMSEDREISIRIAMKYKIYGIKEPLTMVRQHIPANRLGRSPAKEREYYYLKCLRILLEKYNDNPIIKKNKKRLIAGYYFYAGKNYLKENNMGLAKNRFWKSIVYNPFRLNVYIYLFSSLIGNKGFKIINKTRKSILVLSDDVRKIQYKKKMEENSQVTY